MNLVAGVRTLQEKADELRRALLDASSQAELLKGMEKQVAAKSAGGPCRTQRRRWASCRPSETSTDRASRSKLARCLRKHAKNARPGRKRKK